MYVQAGSGTPWSMWVKETPGPIDYSKANRKRSFQRAEKRATKEVVSEG